MAARHGFVSLRCCTRLFETADGPPVLADCSCEVAWGQQWRNSISFWSVGVAGRFWGSFLSIECNRVISLSMWVHLAGLSCGSHREDVMSRRRERPNGCAVIKL